MPKEKQIEKTTNAVEQTCLPKSNFKLGSRRLDELSHVELLGAVNDIWEQKNKEIRTLEAERDGLRNLLKSPLPIHSLWCRFAENAYLLTWFAVIGYLVGVVHK